MTVLRARSTIFCSAIIIRCDLLNSVNAILLPHGLINLSNEDLLKIIIYGHEELPLESNSKILAARLKYIQASKHFE